MEPRECPPLMSTSLALELLQTPPGPIPKSDPLLCGRNWLLKHKPLGGPPDVGGVEGPSPPPSPGPREAAIGGHQTCSSPDSTALQARAPPNQPRPTHNSLPNSYRQLPSHSATDLSYDDFVRQYMEPNRPVVIRGVSSGWRAAAEWRTPDGRLRLEGLRQLAGHCCVCVTDTSDQDDGCGVVRTMQLSEYLDWWSDRAASTQGGRHSHHNHRYPSPPSPRHHHFDNNGDNHHRHQHPQQQPQQQSAGLALERALHSPEPHPTPPDASASVSAFASTSDPPPPPPPRQSTAAEAEAPAFPACGKENDLAPEEIQGEEGGALGGAKRLGGGCGGKLDAAAERALAGPGTSPQGREAAAASATAAAQPLPRSSSAAAAGAASCDVAGPRTAAGGEGLMYLKDWHFVAEFPDYGAYRLPFFFADDWLNAYYDQQRHRREQQHGCESVLRSAPTGNGHAAAAIAAAGAVSAAGGPGDAGPAPPVGAPVNDACLTRTSVRPHAAFTSDYRFLYLGPAGTWTPLHSDVLRSYSWSANVCGRKRWLILHPRYTHLLYDRQMLRMAPHLEPGRVRSGCDPRDFPGLEEARRHAFEFIQEEGDAVFVPSGWHHCVENLHDTLSLNHNWLNGHNCHWTWALLRQQYVDAAEAIEDCRQLCSPDEFEGLVQSNLAANMGLNWHGFVDLLGCTVRSALASLCAARGGLSDARGDPLSGVGSFSQEVATEGGDHCAAVMNQLLALQRAGRLLKDYMAAFEELVLSPAERLERQVQRCGPGSMPNDIQACDRLRQTPAVMNARSLLISIEDELRREGFSYGLGDY